MVRGRDKLTAAASSHLAPPTVGVIPAAGYGSRLGLGGSKEAQLVGGRPVMDFVVERMRTAGAGEIRVVTRPEKLDVIANAASSGASVIRCSPGSLGESLAEGIAGLDGDQVVLIGFPDSIWEPVEGYEPLLRWLEAGFEIALGLFASSDVQPAHVVEFQRTTGAVSAVTVRPGEPGPHLIWGCLAARVRALEGLTERPHPTDFFDALARTGSVGATHLSDSYIDIGTPEGLALARERFG